MALIQTVTCNVCGATKGEGNRWLVGWEAFHGYAISDWPDAEQYAHLRDARDPRVETQHFCGERCALNRQAQYLRRES